MGTAERREREREYVHTLIVEAARDILSEQGLAALSMRAIAERIEYSAGTIYLYFKDKTELVAEVVKEGFGRLGSYVKSDLAALPETASGAEQYAAMGRSYARFALENTAYFRVMFELPGSAQLDCPPPCDDRIGGDEDGFETLVRTLQQAEAEGSLALKDARHAALISWALIHGLVSLYVAGHFAREVHSHEDFFGLLEDAMSSIHAGWRPTAGTSDRHEAVTYGNAES